MGNRQNVPRQTIIDTMAMVVMSKLIGNISPNNILAVMVDQRYAPPYRGAGPMRAPIPGPTPGPGRVVTAWLVHSIPTREPNLDPRKDTMCFRM